MIANWENEGRSEARGELTAAERHRLKEDRRDACPPLAERHRLKEERWGKWPMVQRQDKEVRSERIRAAARLAVAVLLPARLFTPREFLEALGRVNERALAELGKESERFVNLLVEEGRLAWACPGCLERGLVWHVEMKTRTKTMSEEGMV